MSEEGAGGGGGCSGGLRNERGSAAEAPRARGTPPGIRARGRRSSLPLGGSRARPRRAAWRKMRPLTGRLGLTCGARELDAYVCIYVYTSIHMYI